MKQENERRFAGLGDVMTLVGVVTYGIVNRFTCGRGEERKEKREGEKIS
jgi:hypothetical protein